MGIFEVLKRSQLACDPPSKREITGGRHLGLTPQMAEVSFYLLPRVVAIAITNMIATCSALP